MSRHPQVEAILEAWYDLETCAPSEKTESIRRFHHLLDQAIATAGMKSVSRNELKELLAERYNEFKRGKRQEERARLARLR